jgi:carboxypeptidase Taq
VELIHKYISFFPPADHPYDTLLDNYEPGMKTAEVKAIFDGLRPKQVKLIKAIASSRQVQDDFLFKKYNEMKLMDFGVEVITRFGYDWTRGRQDKAPHPFAETFSVNDVRITTRYEDDNPLAMLFSTMHEAGHAMYEQGVNPSYDRTPIAGGTSLAVHESQSRMWENLLTVPAFLGIFLSRVQETVRLAIGRSQPKVFLQGDQQSGAFTDPCQCRRSHIQSACYASS